MNNSQVAHVWAQQEKESGRGSNFYFEGPLLYSYGSHFVVGNIIGTKKLDGEKVEVVLLNSYAYSPSTGKHMSHAYGAVTHMLSFFVPNPEAETKEEHRENYHRLFENAICALGKCRRARKAASYWWEIAEKGAEDAWAYSKIFKLGFRCKQFEMPENVRNWKEKEKKREQDRRAKLKPMGEDWQAGRRADLYGYQAVFGHALMRLKGEDTIETSEGAEFPVEHALRAFKLIEKVVKSGENWFSNGHKIKLGHFSIDKIVDGVIYAGCHRVTFTEAERVKKRLTG